MIYTSIDNKKIKDIKKLYQKKYRDKLGLFLVEGSHLVLEAYKKGCLKELILEQDEVFPLDVETTYVTNNIINYLSQVEAPQNIMGVCIKKEDNKKLGDKVLLLADIQDPGNLGTIIRSAVAFNIDTIILSNKTVDLYNSKVIRASQGMIFHINIIREDSVKIINELKKEHYHVISTKVSYGNDIKKIEKSKKFVIIVGNEGNGVPEEIQDLCDEFIYIEMNNVCESLNVGVAASIILYELDK